MVNVVTIDRTQYVVDVGFGSGGPLSALPLVPSTVHQGIPPNHAQRLIRDHIAPQTTVSDEAQKLWLFQNSFSAGADEGEGEGREGGEIKGWETSYAFTTLEFFPQDYEVMNFATSQKRTSWFTRRIVCMRMILSDEDIAEGEAKGEEPGTGTGTVRDGRKADSDVYINGTLVLFGNEVKRRIGADSEVLQTFQSEEDRIDALSRWFGIHLQPEEKSGVKGLVSEIV